MKNLIVILVIFLTLGIIIYGIMWYYSPKADYQKQTNPITIKVISLEEAVSFLEQCQITSMGQSHDDITNGYFEIKVNSKDGKTSNYLIDSKYKEPFGKKVADIKSFQKCIPGIQEWIE